MRTPLDFFIRLRSLLVFIVLEAVCMVLINRHNHLRDNVVFTTAGSLGGAVVNISSSVAGYFGLRAENDALARENARLLSELYMLRDSAELSLLPESSDSVLTARVCGNSVNRDQNFITIDKGSTDGIDDGMPVSNSDGVIGIVYRTGRHYSLVMPLINVKTNISARVRGDECFGFVKWNGGDIGSVLLTNLPSNSAVAVGDTIETSGFSSVFPKGVPIGLVTDVRKAEGAGLEVNVVPFADFARLGYVFVGLSRPSGELSELIGE